MKPNICQILPSPNDINENTAKKSKLMAARPPPTRPHIGIRPSNHFATLATSSDWGEDDAWDSTSDSESPRQTTLANPWNANSRSAPRPVLRPAHNSSSSTLAFSYTHLTAPNPSSYPPRRNSDTEDTQLPQRPPQQNGWTIVRKSHDRRNTGGSLDEGTGMSGEEDRTPGEADADVEGDMILGDLDSEPEPLGQATSINMKPKPDHGSIRDDVDDIVKGIYRPCLFFSSICRQNITLMGI